MKAEETHKSTTAENQVQPMRQPFFAKEGQGNFFSELNQSSQPFFNASSVQPKLTIGKPNDKYEVEADATADKVVQKLSTNSETTSQLGFNGNIALQTKCESCEEEKLHKKEEPLINGITNIQRRPIFESNAEAPEADLQTKPSSTRILQTKCSECKEEEGNIQEKSENPQSEARSNLQSDLNSSKGGGSPLSPETQTSMSTAFGADFSGVRIHTNSSAVQMNNELNAQAFTNGNDIYFNKGKYDTDSSSGKHLLAHELTHVVQQNGRQDFSGIQMRRTCPASRDSRETEESSTSGGILSTDVVYNESDNKLFIYDFPIDGEALSSTVLENPNWQRAVSMILGDPSMKIGIIGYSDCLGSRSRNRTLRDNRAQSVLNALPADAQNKSIYTGRDWITNFIAPNDTKENRAKNRAVTLRLMPMNDPQKGDSCDHFNLPRAQNLDQFMHLIRCMENRLGLTSPGDAPKALSALRQIYYGNATWSASKNAVWNDVITDRPWSPGDNPGPLLGQDLFNAIQASQVIENNGRQIDIGHLMTGLDAMRNVGFVEPQIGPVQVETGVLNDEWATWAGDLGSAAGTYTLERHLLRMQCDYRTYFESLAGEKDLEGNLDAYGIWIWLQNQQNPTSAHLENLNLNASLSAILMEYYRFTSSEAADYRTQKYQLFLETYGAVITNGRITNRAATIGKFLSPVLEFALLFFGKKFLDVYQGNLDNLVCENPGTQTPGESVDIGTLLGELFIACSKMAEYFVDWLESKL